MNPEVLLVHFNRISDAREAVPRFRQFIIDLSVRGKLVEQDHRDEPASELLERVTMEWQRLFRAGIIKNERVSREIQQVEQPYSLPNNWQWIRLGECLEMINGRAFKPTDWLPVGLPIVRIQNLNNENAPFNYCDESTVQQRHIIDSGCFLISWSGTPGSSFGAFIWRRGKAALNQHIFKCGLIGGAYYDRFLQIAINGRLDEMIAKAHGGVGLQHITKGKLENLPLSLPPLAEQHRIVAKVDELMALCDGLEAARNERGVRQDRLAAASHHQLNDGSIPETFHRSASFYLTHFQCVTARPTHIQQLRETVLNLAVRGRLVAQDPNDEPVARLLAQNDKARHAIADEDRRADEDSQPLLAADDRWNIPLAWDWRALADLVLFIDYRGKTPTKTQRGVRLITAKNVKKSFINISPEEFLSERDYHCWMTRGFPKNGDILFTTEAPMGNAAVVRLSERFALAQRVICFRGYGAVNPDFLTLHLLAEPFQSILDKTATGLTAKGIKAAKLRRLPVAVPPLAEQLRIVAKVNELMELCDRLEAQLTATQERKGSLLAAVLHSALADSVESESRTNSRPHQPDFHTSGIPAHN
jgi:type I restriction enzyme, S subunit